MLGGIVDSHFRGEINEVGDNVTRRRSGVQGDLQRVDDSLRCGLLSQFSMMCRKRRGMDNGGNTTECKQHGRAGVLGRGVANGNDLKAGISTGKTQKEIGGGSFRDNGSDKIVFGEHARDNMTAE